jgi:hypothetical protein
MSLSSEHKMNKELNRITISNEQALNLSVSPKHEEEDIIMYVDNYCVEILPEETEILNGCIEIIEVKEDDEQELRRNL